MKDRSLSRHAITFFVLRAILTQDERGERAEIARLQASRARYALIVSRQMREFWADVFGRDYYTTPGRWIDENYRLVKVCGESRDEMLRVGDRTFFVKIFELRDAAQ
jgi:hypothetical protein